MIKEIKRQRELLRFSKFISDLHPIYGRGVIDYMFIGEKNPTNYYDCIYRQDIERCSINIYIECLRKYCSCDLEINQIKQLLEDRYKYNNYIVYISGYEKE